MMRTSHGLVAALGLIVAGAIGGGLLQAAPEGEIPATVPAMVGPGQLGSPVYPEQQIPIRFDHSRHLKLGMQCATCHTKILGSTRATDFNFPTGAACDGCHGAQHPKPADGPSNCQICHTQTDGVRVTAGLQAPRPKLVFNHKLHLDRGADCSTCHGDMSKVRLATTDHLPREQTCLSCHDGKQAKDTCSTCHPSDHAGKLVTRDLADRTIPKLIPTGVSGWGAAHDLSFIEDHRGIAKAQPGLCQSCHDESFCTDCHTGTVRPLRIHASDYLTAHAMDARAATQDCQSCHRLQSDCLACHERLGLGAGPDRRFGVGSALSFHPEGWSGSPGMPQAHAMAAQRNIATCASCHTEDTCLSCHATTSVGTPGLGVSPHGPAFAGSMRCQALATQNRRVCLKCHTPADPHIECM